VLRKCESNRGSLLLEVSSFPNPKPNLIGAENSAKIIINHLPCNVHIRGTGAAASGESGDARA